MLFSKAITKKIAAIEPLTSLQQKIQFGENMAFRCVLTTILNLFFCFNALGCKNSSADKDSYLMWKYSDEVSHYVNQSASNPIEYSIIPSALQFALSLQRDNKNITKLEEWALKTNQWLIIQRINAEASMHELTFLDFKSSKFLHFSNFILNSGRVKKINIIDSKAILNLAQRELLNNKIDYSKNNTKDETTTYVTFFCEGEIFSRPCRTPKPRMNAGDAG